MIRVRDLPILQMIEDRVRLNSLTATRQHDPDLEQMLERFITVVLGVEEDAAAMRWEAAYFAAYDEDSHDQGQALRAANSRGPASAQSWAKRGWDVTCDDGKELLCLTMIEDALVCVDEGMAGRSKVELEAMVWARQKDVSEADNPVGIRRASLDRTFANLGPRRRGPIAGGRKIERIIPRGQSGTRKSVR